MHVLRVHQAERPRRLDVEAARFVQETALAFQLEPNMAAVFVTERCANLVVSILYDRSVAGEDDRAMRCYEAMLSGLKRRGYLPYRLGIQSMGSMPPASDDSDRLLERLRDAIDPNRILAPGRYEFGATGPGEDVVETTLNGADSLEVDGFDPSAPDAPSLSL